LFPNAINCPYFSEMFSFLDRLTLYRSKEYLDNLKELNKTLQAHYGSIDQDTNKTYSYTAFRDDMLARQVNLY